MDHWRENSEYSEDLRLVTDGLCAHFDANAVF